MTEEKTKEKRKSPPYSERRARMSQETIDKENRRRSAAYRRKIDSLSDEELEALRAKRHVDYIAKMSSLSETERKEILDKRHKYYDNVAKERSPVYVQRYREFNNVSLNNATKHCQRWTIDDVNFLCDNYQKLTKGELAEKLHRSLFSVEKKMFRLGLSRDGKYLPRVK